MWCIFLFQQQAPTSLATGRDGSMTSAAYSVADAKFRTDQNSSPVPSTMNQQVGLRVSVYLGTGRLSWWQDRLILKFVDRTVPGL